MIASVNFLSKLFSFAYRVLDFAFLTTSFLTTSFFMSTETVFNLPTSKSSTFVFELFKAVGTWVSLLISSLSTSAFEAMKSFSAAKSSVSMPVSCSNFF